jgi:hypothetical protein
MAPQNGWGQAGTKPACAGWHNSYQMFGPELLQLFDIVPGGGRTFAVPQPQLAE